MLLQRVILALGLVVSQAWALEKPGEELQDVGIRTQLGAQVDLSLPFTNAEGQRGPLSSFLDPNRPVVLVPVYYSCPRLCGLVLTGVVKLINELDLGLGQDYQLVAVSFDPEEGADLAAKRRDNYFTQLVQKSPELGQQMRSRFQFLVGDAAPVSALMKQIGFFVKKDHDEFAHGAAIMILTPQGKISQYFTGISFVPFDVRLSLVEASQGAIGSLTDHVYLFCFRFDQTQGKYVWAAFGIMRLGGVVTLALLGGLVVRLLVLERRKRKQQLPGTI